MRDIEGMQRLARTFAQSRKDVLQELVNLAVELCDADSAGISIVRSNASDEEFYEWIATAGVYDGFLNAILPRYPSACGVTLDRGRPQHFRVDQRFFDLLGVTAQPVLDGILLPWSVDGISGTIFVMSHGNSLAFDAQDARVMQILADFAATAVHQQRQQELLVQQARASAAQAMAHSLAHRINNPLQSLTNTLYLAQHSTDAATATHAQQAEAELHRLSLFVKDLLALYRNSPGPSR
jgi:signal transduction histidine kinase